MICVAVVLILAGVAYTPLGARANGKQKGGDSPGEGDIINIEGNARKEDGTATWTLPFERLAKIHQNTPESRKQGPKTRGKPLTKPEEPQKATLHRWRHRRSIGVNWNNFEIVETEAEIQRATGRSKRIRKRLPEIPEERGSHDQLGHRGRDGTYVTIPLGPPLLRYRPLLPLLRRIPETSPSPIRSSLAPYVFEFDRYRIRNILVTAYHPQSNGLERGDQNIVDAPAKLMAPAGKPGGSPEYGRHHFEYPRQRLSSA